MHVRWIALTSFVALSTAGAASLSGVGLAQAPAAAAKDAAPAAEKSSPSTAVLGKDDIAFATALKRERYTDLAEKLLKVIEREGKVGPEEGIGLKALHLDLRLELAQREFDPTKRKELLRTIVQEKEDLVTQYKGRPVAEEVRNSLPDTYRQLVDAITAAIAREKDADLIALLQKEGSDVCTRAEDAFKKRIEELGIVEAETPATTQQLLAARFNLPRMLYFHALLYPKTEFRRKDLLEQAIKGFQEFGLDYNEYLENYEALILEGLCSKELEKQDDAKAAFRDAYKFPETLGFEKNSKGEYPLSEEMAGTVSEGVLQLMNLLLEEKDPAGALAIAKDYFDTTPGALEARRGLAILGAKAEALLAINDTRGAAEVADQLVQNDERGPWGAKGREIQGRLLGSGPVDPKRGMAIARAAFDRGDEMRALQLMRQVVDALKGSPDAATLGPDAYLFLGSMFARRGYEHEAALAFDTGAERFPASDQAPELVFQSIQRYLAINKDDRRPYFKKRIEERMKLLASKYPNSDRAQGAVMIEGDQAAGEQRYLDAAELYSKVQPSSKSAYFDAQSRTGEMYFRHAIEVLGPDPNKAAEVKTYVGQAESYFKKVITDVEAALKKTVAFDETARLESVGLRARMFLAQLYLRTDRPAEVLTMLEGADERYAQNGDAISGFWTFRIQALQKLGRLEEAVTKLDDLARRDAKSKAVAAAAPLVATSIDEQALALDSAGKKAEAKPLYKKAAKYYVMGARALLAGDSPRTTEIDPLANRMLALGLILNEVPEKQNTFVGWDPSRNKDPELFQLTAELFSASLKIKPSTKGRASLGSMYGFLGQWEQASTTFAELFENQPLLVGNPKRINIQVANANPELLVALFEQAVAENTLGRLKNERERFGTAQTTFDQLGKVCQQGGWNWWHAHYYAIKNKADDGKYSEAKADFNEFERRNDFAQSPGLADELAALKAELATK